MTMVERNTVELPVCRWGEAHGIPHYKMSTQFTRSWPDRMHLVPGGRPVFIEYKRPGAVPTPKQQVKIDSLHALGYAVFIVDDKRDGIFILEQALANKPEIWLP